MMSGGKDRDPTPRPFYIVAAHGGAGYHLPTSDSLLKRSLRIAISSALTVFSRTPTLRGTASSGGAPTESLALDAVTSLIAALEDAPEFNAGYGSNLTFDGNVECDASLMSTTTSEEDGEEDDNDHHPSSLSSQFSFGSVGAVRGVRNPVSLARRVLEGRRRRRPERERDRVGLGLGRVPPLMLVGEGAVQFAREQSSIAGAGVSIVDDPEEMVAPRARREWCVWKERYRRWEDESDTDPALLGLGLDLALGRERGREGENEVSADVDNDSGGGTGPLYARQDTVGAVALVRVGEAGDGDAQQQVAAAGVSSGGLLLKHSGRVGEAAVFGAGCWAERLAGGRSVACSVSGQGELIVQSSLAKTLAERIATTAEGDTHDALRSVLVDHFYSKWHRQGEYQPAVGVLLLTRGVDGDEGTGL
ncbi:nucleophile aminohydrolase [Russula compacta]|nr:nucleophile aminohydrolase [Russula compacta]